MTSRRKQMKFRELGDVRPFTFVTPQFWLRSSPNRSPNFNQFIKDYDETIRISNYHSRQFVFSRSHLRLSTRGVFPSALPRKGGGDSWIDSIFI